MHHIFSHDDKISFLPKICIVINTIVNNVQEKVCSLYRGFFVFLKSHMARVNFYNFGLQFLATDFLKVESGVDYFCPFKFCN